MVSLFQVKAIDTVELFIRSVCNMGSYLNPGSASFRNSLRSKIYVDCELPEKVPPKQN